MTNSSFATQVVAEGITHERDSHEQLHWRGDAVEGLGCRSAAADHRQLTGFPRPTTQGCDDTANFPLIERIFKKNLLRWACCRSPPLRRARPL